MPSGCFGNVDGAIDRVAGIPLPIVRVFGWIDSDLPPPLTLELCGGESRAPFAVYRTWRPDLADRRRDLRIHCGFIAEFMLGAGDIPDSVRTPYVRVPIADGDRYGSAVPHYVHLFTAETVSTRDKIYGHGPPTDVGEDIKLFARRLAGRVLDFGCGNGDLVCWLRQVRGVDATGLELATPRIEANLKAAARPHVLIYEGGCPLPFRAEEFDCVFSTEVIEHIPDIERYVPELHRVLKPRGRLFLTTPDISSIPSGFPAGIVPWHLLEATHYRFFSGASLPRLFASHFETQELLRFGGSWINGDLYIPGSLGAVLVAKVL